MPANLSERAETIRKIQGLDRKFVGCFYIQKRKDGNFYRMRRGTAKKVGEKLRDPEITKFATSDIHWDQIYSKKEQDIRNVYDITVGNNHNFLTAEGLVIHNCVDLQFDSDFTALLYNDFDLRDDSTLYFVDENGKSQPVIEISVIKNKTGGFKGKLYYKFYKSFSKIVEASREEMETYFQDFIGR